MTRVAHHARKPLRRFGLPMLALALSVALTACGGAEEAAQSASGNAKVTAGVVPAMPAAAIYVGLKEDLFAAQKVDLKAQPAQTGAAVVASLLNGEIQVGYISSVVAIRAMSEGVPIRFAANGDVVPSDTAAQMYGGLVTADGGVKDFAQLEGKTVAVNALQGVDHLALVTAVDEAGGDHKKVKVVEVAYPEQWSALKAGRIDAAVMSDPFYSDALANGGKATGNMLTALGSGAMIAGYVVSDEFATKNADVVERFSTAMREASATSNSEPDLVRSVIPEFSHIESDAAKNIILPTFAEELDASALQTVIDLMVKYEFIKKDLDAENLIAK